MANHHSGTCPGCLTLPRKSNIVAGTISITFAMNGKASAREGALVFEYKGRMSREHIRKQKNTKKTNSANDLFQELTN